MRILIVKDSATRIAREVADRAEALSIQARGFTVLEVGDDDLARPLSASEPVAAPQPDPQEAPAEPAKPPSKKPNKKPAKP